MRKFVTLGLLASALVVGGISLAVTKESEPAEAQDTTIIVKLNDKASRENVLNEISKNITKNYKVRSVYSNVINGFVMDVPSQYVSHIRNLSRVELVNYNHMVTKDTINNDGFNYKIMVDSTKTASSSTMEKPEGTNEGKGTFVAILDNGFYIGYDENGNEFHHNVFSPLENDDVFVTQASLKAKIDSAETFHGKYDENHSTYFNNKVPFYYDYGGDVPGGIPNPDYEVYAEGQDHGTHVASIAAGNAGSEYEGIAPKAQLALMKVFVTYYNDATQSYASGAPEAAILDALEDCLVLGVDVINMSLGSNLDDFDSNSIVQEAIKTLEKKGTFTSIANGNEGKGTWSESAYRYFTTDMVETNIIGSYSNNMSAMSVASAQADYKFYGEAITVDGKNVRFEDQVTNYNTTDGPVTYSPERHLTDLIDLYSKKEFDYVFINGLGEESDYEGKDVSGKIVIVNRGEITFREKVDVAINKGAIAVGIIDNTSATEFNMRMSFGDKNDYTPSVPVFFMLNSDKATFENAESTKLYFVINEDLDNPTTRTVSDYSSDGMRYDLSIKPEISTPGEDIKGAVLGAVDKYESMSGTSMAAPNFAGALALMISNHLGDENYRETINARLMSTAHPMKDYTAEKNYTTVRRQGAGMVNLDGAINSEIYLDGVKDNERIGKAKIELFNNEDIANGILNLSFYGINESSSAATYKATTYVLAPEVTEYDPENYPSFANTKMQSINTQLVETFEDDITINPGSNLITLPSHNIADDKLEALDEDFANGVVLDGFVILTPEDTSLKQLSIPFLGFYGDYENISPAEAFDFEQSSTRAYDSDILNYLLRDSLINNYPNADFTSRIVAGYWKHKNNISTGNVITNQATFTSIKDDNGNKVYHLGYNPYTNELDNDTLYVGSSNLSNTLLVQQYMMRSVKDNTISISKLSDNTVISTGHLEDTLSGLSKDSETGETIYPLYKSHFDTALFDGGYMAHRAMGSIELLDNNGKALPAGEYKLNFEYTLANDGHFAKSYNLTIVNDVPVISSIEKVTVGDNNYVRIHYNDKLLLNVTIDKTEYTPVITEEGAYIDVLASESSNAIKISSLDFVNGSENYITHIDDKNFVMVYSAQMFNGYGYDFTYAINKHSSNDQVISFEYTREGKTITPSGDVQYKMLVPAGLDIETLSIKSVASNGKERDVEFTIEGDFIVFTSGFRTFHLTSTGTTPDDDPTPSKGCGGEIVTTSVILSVLSLAGVILLLARKKKED